MLEKEKGEKVLHIYKDTGLYDGNVNNDTKGILYLTPFRLIWSDEITCYYLQLSNIVKTKFEAGFLRSSPKIILTMKVVDPAKLQIEWTCDICQCLNKSEGKCMQCGVVGKQLSCPTCTFKNLQNAISCEICGGALVKSFTSEDFFDVKIAFRGRSIDPIQDIHSLLQQTIDSLDDSFPSDQAITISSMGVSGIMKSLEDASKKRDVAVSASSFKDLESLMDKAQEMTKLAESLMLKFKSDDGLEGDVTIALQRDLIDFGILQPVTKETSRNKYFLDLAKELSEFLVQYSKRSEKAQYGLSDAFCLFNRARGLSLVSPQDLFRAATQMKSLSMAFELKSFDSGVHVLVESNQMNSDAMSNRIVEILHQEQEFGVTATLIASRLNISVIVAKEQMLVAEKGGLICRDDSMNGLFFYPNIFL